MFGRVVKFVVIQFFKKKVNSRIQLRNRLQFIDLGKGIILSYWEFLYLFIRKWTKIILRLHRVPSRLYRACGYQVMSNRWFPGLPLERYIGVQLTGVGFQQLYI